MTHPVLAALRCAGPRRRIAVAGAALTMAAAAGAPPAGAADAPVPGRQALIVLLHDHYARSSPSVRARRIAFVPARRPLTGVRTVLPVLDRATGAGAASWARVRLPGRPNGHAGWIPTARTRPATTGWSITVRLSLRRVTVSYDARVIRRFRAVVGKPSTPTPRGRFFVEEALALEPGAPGAPFALASSARSTVLQEFEGGPGQIALHGTGGLAGAPGTAASHGCVRLTTPAITWLARRIGAGTPLTVTD
ncbi:L,D-transpeptidase [Baekduia soli]|uniref:L,D-transpeptidase n=1 Tax=Baekduia soli TaxID=496014 RepID=A0A5B8U5K8_9ACTN|nr:L,D-transpeptidase [Baekduia soli]QEC47932.1 L,D-transpeptidase [Baekduia soli]